MDIGWPSEQETSDTILGPRTALYTVHTSLTTGSCQLNKNQAQTNNAGSAAEAATAPAATESTKAATPTKATEGRMERATATATGAAMEEK